METDPHTCAVCKDVYNNSNRRPLVLPCSHSFCQRCIVGVKDSPNAVCPVCRLDLATTSIQNFAFCNQLIPGEDYLHGKTVDAAVKPKDKSTKRTQTNEPNPSKLCKDHDDQEYIFWCKFCECPGCKTCLHRLHKNCDWVLLEDCTRNLHQEFRECLNFYTEEVHKLHQAGFDNRSQIKTVRRVISNLNEFEDKLDSYYGVLASMHSQAEGCLDDLAKCEKDASSGKVEPLSLLMSKGKIATVLQGLLVLPEQPVVPLLQLTESDEASNNTMSLLQEAKRAKLQFPKTLAGFGYCFINGKLQNMETGEGFNFAVQPNNHAYNQAHYEALGEVMNEHVYDLLSNEGGLKRLPLPPCPNEDLSDSFFFASDNWKTCNRLMILINGSGVVRAGQWARRLIINDSLNSGTMLPYINRAKSEGYGVLVMNTNHNRAVDEAGHEWPIRGSEDPTSHADSVWRHYVLKSAAKNIAIVAHSYGGCVATHLYTNWTKDFKKRVFAVALTDSVHMIHNPTEFHTFIQVSRNWVTSSQPLDTDLSYSRPGDVFAVSAGVTAHEMTSWGGFNSVFEFFSEQYHDITNDHIPRASQQDYLFYPPYPQVRQEVKRVWEKEEDATATQQHKRMSWSSEQPGAAGGGIGSKHHDHDEQGQASDGGRGLRSRKEKREKEEDNESTSDGGRKLRREGRRKREEEDDNESTSDGGRKLRREERRKREEDNESNDDVRERRSLHNESGDQDSDDGDTRRSDESGRTKRHHHQRNRRNDSDDQDSDGGDTRRSDESVRTKRHHHRGNRRNDSDNQDSDGGGHTHRSDGKKEIVDRHHHRGNRRNDSDDQDSDGSDHTHRNIVTDAGDHCARLYSGNTRPHTSEHERDGGGEQDDDIEEGDAPGTGECSEDEQEKRQEKKSRRHRSERQEKKRAREADQQSRAEERRRRSGDEESEHGDRSGRGDDRSGRGDDRSGRGDDRSGRGDDRSGRGDDRSGRGDDRSGRGDDRSGRGDESCDQYFST